MQPVVVRGTPCNYDLSITIMKKTNHIPEKKDHFVNVSPLRKSREVHIHHALATSEHCGKSCVNPEIECNELRAGVIHALAHSAAATNAFLAHLSAIKRYLAHHKEERRIAGIEKRRGPRDPKWLTKDGKPWRKYQ